MHTNLTLIPCRKKKYIKIVTVSYSQCLRKCATGIRQHFKCVNIVRSLLAWQDALPASACWNVFHHIHAEMCIQRIKTP